MKQIGDNRSVCNFILAVDDVHTKEDRADFIRIAVYGKSAELCARYLQKGFLAGVTGRLRSEGHTDSEGIMRYAVNVIADNVRFCNGPRKKKLNRVSIYATDAADGDFSLRRFIHRESGLSFPRRCQNGLT